MNSLPRTLLQELRESGLQNDAREQERSNKMLNLEPETAHLVSMLVRNGHRKNVLEIGTSNGYSTLWLAWAVSTVNGRVTSIDRDAHKHQLADTNLQRAHLRDFVELRTGNATDVVTTLSGPFDCVFFDADRLSAPSQLKLLLDKFASDVMLLADNALSHPQEIAPYLAALSELSEFDTLILPIGKGVSVAYRGSTM